MFKNSGAVMGREENNIQKKSEKHRSKCERDGQNMENIFSFQKDYNVKSGWKMTGLNCIILG